MREDWGAGPTGDDAFVILSLGESIEQGPARVDFDGPAQTERITQAWLDNWTFEAYGRNAYAFAQTARAALQSETGKTMLRKLKAGMVSLGPLLDFSGLAGSEEERARFTFVLSTNQITDTALESIERANIDVIYTTLDDQTWTEHVRVEPPDLK